MKCENIKDIKNKYKNFFEYIKKINLKYELEGDNIIIKHQEVNCSNDNTINDKTIIFDNIILPPNLKIYHFSIVIKNYPQKRLPSNLYIEASLIIEKSPKLHYFGKNTFAEYIVGISCFLKKLEHVKSNFISVNSSLLKEISNIETQKLDVTSCSSLNKINKNVLIHEYLNVSETNLKKLPVLNLKTLNISNTKIKKLAPQTIITDTLKANDSDLEKLLDNMDLDNLSINSCKKLKKLGKNLKVHTLLAKDSGLRSLPNNLFLKLKHDERSNNENVAIVEINSTKIKKIPKTIKGHGKIITGNLLIENIHNFYNNKNISFYVEDYQIFLIQNLKVENNSLLEFEFILKQFPKSKYDFYEQYVQNTLLFNSTNAIERKFLLGYFDKITNKEIEQLKNSYTITNKNRDVLNKKKEYSDIKFNLINYCRSKQAFEFLYKNGYHFTQEECKTIKENEIKNIYEIYLLKDGLTKSS